MKRRVSVKKRSMKEIKGYGDLSNIKLNSPKKQIDATVEDLDKSGMGLIN